jgi:hypothetical protein
VAQTAESNPDITEADLRVFVQELPKTVTGLSSISELLPKAAPEGVLGIFNMRCISETTIVAIYSQRMIAREKRVEIAKTIEEVTTIESSNGLSPASVHIDHLQQLPRNEVLPSIDVLKCRRSTHLNSD